MRAILLILAALASAGLTERQTRLLVANQYTVQPDGAVADRAGQPVPASEVPFVVQRLESAERLKALLRVNIILNASEGEKRLTAAEKESIRAIAREAWPYFPLATRKDFRRYFTPEELFNLEKDPPPVVAIPGVDLKDQEPEITEPARPAARPAAPAAAAAAPAAPVPTAPPPAAPVPAPSAPAPAPVLGPKQISFQVPTEAPAPTVPPILMPARLEGAGAPAAAPVPVVTVDTSAAKGFYFAGAAPAPAASSDTVIVVPEPAPLPAAPAVSTETAAVPAVSTVPAPAPEPPAPAVVVVPPPMPPATPVTQEALELFLVKAPYTRDAKTLLRLIREHAPEKARDRALNAAMFALPAIVFDGERAGLSWRGRLLDGSTTAAVIALRPSLVVRAHKRLFFGGEELVLPDAPAAYAGLGVAAPAAASGDEGFTEEKGDWGDQRRYADGSLRVKLPLETLAGALLEELLRLDARLRLEDGSAEEVERAAEQAKMLMFASLHQAHGHLKWLDLAAAEDFRLWLEHPDEWRDALAHARPPAGAAPRPSPLRAEVFEAERRFRASQGGGDGR